MLFDFRQQYKHKSNTELLLIVRQPGEYQPEAVTVAREILDLRDVSNREFDYVDDILREKEKAARAEVQKRESFRKKVADFFEPLVTPTEKVEAAKWWRFFLLVLVIQYAYWIWTTIKATIAFLNCSVCRIDFFTGLQLLMLLFIPTNIYLVYKRKAAGWKIFFAGYIFIVLSSLIVLVYDLIARRFPVELVVDAWQLALALAFIIFLWRQSIADYFGVSEKAKKKTLWASVLVVLVWNLFLFLL